MKQKLLKTFFLCLFALTGMTASAYDCKVDGIYYNLNATPSAVKASIVRSVV